MSIMSGPQSTTVQHSVIPSQRRRIASIIFFITLPIAHILLLKMKNSTHVERFENLTILSASFSSR